MGVRNPARLSVDKETDRLIAGWVGPDAGAPSHGAGARPSTRRSPRSPRRATTAGRTAWATSSPTATAIPSRQPDRLVRLRRPEATSRRNTGLVELPPVTPVNMWYSPQGGGPVFPIDPRPAARTTAASQTFTQPYLRSGGGQAVMSGPMYRYDDSERADRWPAFWDGKWFVGDECGGNSRVAVALDDDAVDDHRPPKAAVDIEAIVGEDVGGLMGWRFGPDGQLYVLDYGTGFFTVSDESALWRVRYTGGPSTPVASPTATSDGLEVTFSSAGSGGVSYEWDFGDGSPTVDDAEPDARVHRAGRVPRDADGDLRRRQRVGPRRRRARARAADAEPPVTTAVVDGANVSFRASDGGGARLADTEYRIDGGPWTNYGRAEESIFDGTAASLGRWLQAAGGLVRAAARRVDRERRRARDAVVPGHRLRRLLAQAAVPRRERGIDRQLRRVRALPGPAARRPAGLRRRRGRGVGRDLLRPGDPDQRPPGVGETQKTGSIYNFDPIGLGEAGEVPKGEWSDDEIRVIGQRYWVLRDGAVINTFDNEVPRESSRAGDPPTSERQFEEGYVGVQNHGANDKIQIRDIRVQTLGGGGSGPFEVTGPGTHTVEFRSTDTAGNVEAVKSQAVTIPGGEQPPGSPPGTTPPAPTPPGGTEPGAAFGVRTVGRPRLAAFARNGLRLTVGCDATGTGRAALKVTSSTRRRLRLRSTTLATETVRCTAGRTATVRLEPSSATARRLRAGLRRRRATKRLDVVLELRMRPAGGDRTQVLQRRMTLRR